MNTGNFWLSRPLPIPINNKYQVDSHIGQSRYVYDQNGVNRTRRGLGSSEAHSSGRLTAFGCLVGIVD